MRLPWLPHEIHLSGGVATFHDGSGAPDVRDVGRALAHAFRERLQELRLWTHVVPVHEPIYATARGAAWLAHQVARGTSVTKFAPD
jgi:hypothetical protein